MTPPDLLAAAKAFVDAQCELEKSRPEFTYEQLRAVQSTFVNLRSAIAAHESSHGWREPRTARAQAGPLLLIASVSGSMGVIRHDEIGLKSFDAWQPLPPPPEVTKP